MNRLCTICARGGSKGVKGKNLRNLNDKPLMAYSISHAKECGLFDCIAVSSDSDEILAAAASQGVDQLIKRPHELATDKAAKLPAIRNCVSQVERETDIRFDIIVDLDVTSPLRSPDDIVLCVELLESSGTSNVITGTPSRRSPYFNLVELDERGVAKLSKQPDIPVVRRQDAPKCYDMNASIYAWRRKTLFNSSSVFNSDTLLYVMPEERSIDIDTALDFEFVEFLLQKRANHDE